MSISDLNSESCFFEEFDLETGSDRHIRSGRNSTDEKKRIHNELERKRRGTIKENFDQLYSVIPHDDSEKPSRAQILTRAINHITNIQAFDTQREKFESACELDIKYLEDELSRLKDIKSYGENPLMAKEISQRLNEVESRKPPKFDDYNLSFLKNSNFSGGVSRTSMSSNGYSPHNSEGRLSNVNSKVDRIRNFSTNSNLLNRKNDDRVSINSYCSHPTSDHTYMSSVYCHVPQNSLLNQESTSSDGSRNRRILENNGYLLRRHAD